MGICEATDAQGNVQTDPAVYKPLICQAVSEKFSHRADGPAVYTARPSTCEELSTGRPFWYNELYNHDPSNLAPDA